MKLFKVFFLILFLGLGKGVLAQYQAEELELRIEFKSSVLSPLKGSLKVSTQEHQPNLGNVNGFKYEAFFCKMEQNAINKWGVCIQVHAGDYNNYSVPPARRVFKY